MSQESFAELGVSRAVVGALTEQGIITPFPIQRKVTADVLDGRDVLVRSPTGSGKTLAFGIPITDRIVADARRPAALILAPTRELATQIVDELRPLARARALRITAVYGGVGLERQGREAATSHILVATPGRLEDHLQRGTFTLAHVRILVLDEADRMLDMGFRPAVDRIVGACPAERQTLFFSATLDGVAGEIARGYTRDPRQHEHGPTARRAAEAVEHRFVATTHDRRLDSLVAELQAERDLALVFVRTKRGADRLVKRLASEGIEAVAMHGNKSQRQRERALAEFESGAVDTLVATDVAARGIDVSGISHVINFDPPIDGETYVHRIGRTGRAGRTGVGITLVAAAERGEVVKLARGLGLDATLEQSGGPRHDQRVHAGSHRPEHGHEPHGHQSHGHQSHGHQSHGHQSHGHQSHGHQSHGHQSHGHQRPEAATASGPRRRRRRNRRRPTATA